MLTAKELESEFQRVRSNSTALCGPLEAEDYCLQGMADASPPKWHLAHTTWFFETFVLKEWLADYQSWRPLFEHLFNSYYNAVGQPFSRPLRGMLSRPCVAEVMDYRRLIDERILSLMLANQDDNHLLKRIELGLHHEQQHQELLLTDIKYSFSLNPLLPAYQKADDGVCHADSALPKSVTPQWQDFEGGLLNIGCEGNGFCFDNETPVHQQFIQPFSLAQLPVTNGEYLQFIHDGGYHNAALWLADGWDQLQQRSLAAPLYWKEISPGHWRQFTLHGESEIDTQAPVCHISYYEADAFTRWSGTRLPTEYEWEYAARNLPVSGNFLGRGLFHPQRVENADSLAQIFGDVWEWTSSSYLPYPGYSPDSGAVGEYNGKFMCNQQVLKGGSCVSDNAHIRPSYRNFFHPGARWQFSGLRVARSI